MKKRKVPQQLFMRAEGKDFFAFLLFIAVNSSSQNFVFNLSGNLTQDV
jgi:hypothetical protein